MVNSDWEVTSSYEFSLCVQTHFPRFPSHLFFIQCNMFVSHNPIISRRETFLHRSLNNVSTIFKQSIHLFFLNKSSLPNWRFNEVLFLNFFSLTDVKKYYFLTSLRCLIEDLMNFHFLTFQLGRCEKKILFKQFFVA